MNYNNDLLGGKQAPKGDKNKYKNSNRYILVNNCHNALQFIKCDSAVLNVDGHLYGVRHIGMYIGLAIKLGHFDISLHPYVCMYVMVKFVNLHGEILNNNFDRLELVKTLKIFK